MWGNSEPVGSWCSDDFPGAELMIERHCRQTIEMTNADNLRFLAGCSRADDFVPFCPETLAQIVRKLFEVVRDVLHTKARQKLQARLALKPYISEAGPVPVSHASEPRFQPCSKLK